MKKSRLETFNDYESFVEKFKPKKTTDDCYTPPAVYGAVLNWVLEQCPDLRGHQIIRPFYPGGDYENCGYPERCIVVDNPPFSILAQIRRFYQSQGIKYFLFAPHLTVLGPKDIEDTAIIVNATIEYENGAIVNTAFVSNLFGDIVAMTAPGLATIIKDAQEKSKADKPVLLKYNYPPEVITASRLAAIVKGGIEFTIRRSEASLISRLDSQREQGKGIFGKGLIVSAAKAEEAGRKAEEARKFKAEEERKRKAAEKEEEIVWELSDREKELVRRLGI